MSNSEKFISERLIEILCDPEGKVCTNGSEEDNEILQQAIEDLKILEVSTYNLSCRKCPLYLKKVNKEAVDE